MRLPISNLVSRILMPYRYLDNIAIADEAFEAWGVTLEETFAAASDAMINVMVTDLDTVKGRESRNFRIEAARQDMLLFRMLQELIYYKDAEQLLLRTKSIRIESQAGGWNALVEAAGERIDPSRHDLIVDVKAVTLYRLRVEQNPHGWSATVVVDV